MFNFVYYGRTLKLLYFDRLNGVGVQKTMPNGTQKFSPMFIVNIDILWSNFMTTIKFRPSKILILGIMTMGKPLTI